MKRHARRMLSAVTLAGLTFALAAQAAFSGAGDTDVRFQAVGPAGLTIDGEGTGLTVNEEGGKVKMVAALTGLKTGMALRDKHLKNYLHVDKHPQATLVVDRGPIVEVVSKIDLIEDGQEGPPRAQTARGRDARRSDHRSESCSAAHA